MYDNLRLSVRKNFFIKNERKIIAMLKNFLSFLLAVFSMLNLFVGFSIYASDQADDSSEDIVYVVPENSDLSETSRDTYETVNEEENGVSFVVDEELADFIMKKDRLAEEFSEALNSGNTEVATQKLNEFKQLTNDQTDDNVIADGPITNPDEGIAPCYEAVILSRIYQYPQETSYYCGPAAAQSILYHKGISCSQTKLAKSLRTTEDEGTGWFLLHGNSKDQFPMATTLTNLTGINYTPAPYGPPGDNPLSLNALKSRIQTALFADHGVAVLGTSKAPSSDESHMPGYPNRPINHWIVCYGWNVYDEAFIIDPAKADPDIVKWSNSIEAYYKVPGEKLTAFAAAKGIIY